MSWNGRTPFVSAQPYQKLLLMHRNRLALSHNYIQTFPTRFSECTSLRYLNVRQNRIKEFPLAVSHSGLPSMQYILRADWSILSYAI